MYIVNSISKDVPIKAETDYRPPDDRNTNREPPGADTPLPEAVSTKEAPATTSVPNEEALSNEAGLIKTFILPDAAANTNGGDATEDAPAVQKHASPSEKNVSFALDVQDPGPSALGKQKNNGKGKSKDKAKEKETTRRGRDKARQASPVRKENKRKQKSAGASVVDAVAAESLLPEPPDEGPPTEGVAESEASLNELAAQTYVGTRTNEENEVTSPDHRVESSEPQAAGILEPLAEGGRGIAPAEPFKAAPDEPAPILIPTSETDIQAVEELARKDAPPGDTVQGDIPATSEEQGEAAAEGGLVGEARDGAEQDESVAEKFQHGLEVKPDTNTSAEHGLIHRQPGMSESEEAEEIESLSIDDDDVPVENAILQEDPLSTALDASAEPEAEIERSSGGVPVDVGEEPSEAAPQPGADAGHETDDVEESVPSARKLAESIELVARTIAESVIRTHESPAMVEDVADDAPSAALSDGCGDLELSVDESLVRLSAEPSPLKEVLSTEAPPSDLLVHTFSDLPVAAVTEISKPGPSAGYQQGAAADISAQAPCETMTEASGASDAVAIDTSAETTEDRSVNFDTEASTEAPYQARGEAIGGEAPPGAVPDEETSIEEIPTSQSAVEETLAGVAVENPTHELLEMSPKVLEELPVKAAGDVLRGILTRTEPSAAATEDLANPVAEGPIQVPLVLPMEELAEPLSDDTAAVDDKPTAGPEAEPELYRAVGEPKSKEAASVLPDESVAVHEEPASPTIVSTSPSSTDKRSRRSSHRTDRGWTCPARRDSDVSAFGRIYSGRPDSFDSKDAKEVAISQMHDKRKDRNREGEGQKPSTRSSRRSTTMTEDEQRQARREVRKLEEAPLIKEEAARRRRKDEGWRRRHENRREARKIEAAKLAAVEEGRMQRAAEAEEEKRKRKPRERKEKEAERCRQGEQEEARIAAEDEERRRRRQAKRDREATRRAANDKHDRDPPGSEMATRRSRTYRTRSPSPKRPGLFKSSATKSVARAGFSLFGKPDKLPPRPEGSRREPERHRRRTSDGEATHRARREARRTVKAREADTSVPSEARAPRSSSSSSPPLPPQGDVKTASLRDVEADSCIPHGAAANGTPPLEPLPRSTGERPESRRTGKELPRRSSHTEGERPRLSKMESERSRRSRRESERMVGRRGEGQEKKGEAPVVNLLGRRWAFELGISGVV